MASLEAWKSPRAVEAEIRGYKYERFEYYMGKVDAGEMVLSLAQAAIAEEIAYIDSEEHGAA